MHETRPLQRLPIPHLLFAIDSPTIAVSPNEYDWERYRTNKGAIRLRTQLDLSGNLPCLVVTDNGRMANIRSARK